MPKYVVTFKQYHEYEVEAEDEYEAEKEAQEEFVDDMRSPIANTLYDEVEVEEVED